jgi:FkbM family methyltransferase
LLPVLLAIDKASSTNEPRLRDRSCANIGVMPTVISRPRSSTSLAVRQHLKALRDPAYRATRRRDRELERLETCGRSERGVTELLDERYVYLDGRNFSLLYRSIFVREIYRFDSDESAPVIFDCGANIGLATRYWKKAFPHARITAFEPDDAAAAAFVDNMRLAGIQDVDLQQTAVWIETGHVLFASPGTDNGRLSGRIAEVGDRDFSTPTRVPTTRLRDLLVEPVDFLKFDIEGAEVDVIRDCVDQLHLVKRMFVEYHGFAEQPQRLAELLEVLKSVGFRCYVEHEGDAPPRPFVMVPAILGMDVQLNIFCTRTVA